MSYHPQHPVTSHTLHWLRWYRGTTNPSQGKSCQGTSFVHTKEVRANRRVSLLLISAVWPNTVSLVQDWETFFLIGINSDSILCKLLSETDPDLKKVIDIATVYLQAD